MKRLVQTLWLLGVVVTMSVASAQSQDEPVPADVPGDEPQAEVPDPADMPNWPEGVEPAPEEAVPDVPDTLEPPRRAPSQPAGPRPGLRPTRGSTPRFVTRQARDPLSPEEEAALSAAGGRLSADEGLRLNFRNAPLDSVLNYLSEAAGFVIVQDTEVSGTVNVMSHQPLNEQEAVDLLNVILVEKGYIAIRNGRILRIVQRDEAHKYDLPVRTGSDPEAIPRKEEMVTQIIPVRYADALKLVENITPLLVENATLTANESSNAIVLTDTQTNIRRMVEIIKALDTSISGISAIRVFPLQFADAKELADVVTDLFENGTGSGRNSRDPRAAMMARFRMGRGGGPEGGGNGATGNSEARQAASRVVAVADERSNSLVVAAPEEMIATIEQLVEEIDVNIDDITEVRIFRLENADAVETAEILNQLFEETDQNQNRSNRGRGGPPFMRGGANQQQSQRSLQQSKVMAVGDPRTNSLLVTAARETMMQIAEMIGRLDATSDKKQIVKVYPLEHADVDNVAGILRGMFEEQYSNSRNSQQNDTSRLTTRSTQGASSTLNTTLGGRQGSGGTRR